MINRNEKNIFRSFKKLIRPRTYDSLKVAVENAAHCRKLHIVFHALGNNFGDQGKTFLELKKLEELKLQGLIAEPSNFFLPSEIGEVVQLKKLVLLNLPIEVFPEWIFKLNKLQYLTIRGNEIREIPKDIGKLKKLQVLRVENCELAQLPKELGELKELRYLGLADTKIKRFCIEHLPPNLKELGIGGPLYGYDRLELARVRKSLPKTKVYSMIN